MTSTPVADPVTAAPTAPPEAGDFRLEVAVVPVSDVEQAKQFYVETLGWRMDADFAMADGLSVVQVTPPGSPTAVIFGSKISAATPGSVDSLVLAVADIETARNELSSRGVPVSAVFHDAGGAFHHAGDNGRVEGADPLGRSYGSWASFADPDGNQWYLQEIQQRRPGR